MKRLRSIIGLDVRPAPDYVLSRVLAAGVAESMTVPTAAGKGAICIFGYSTTPCYVNCRATAAVPTDIADGTAAEATPTAYELNGGDTVSVIAPATCIVTMAVYASAVSGQVAI